MFRNSKFARALVRNYNVNIFRNPTTPVQVPIQHTFSRLAIGSKHNIKNFGSVAANEPFLDPKIATDRIIEVVKNFEKVDATKVSPNARFKEDLDLDSLDAVEVVMAIEEEFAIEIPDSEADKILSISDAIAYVSSHPMAK